MQVERALTGNFYCNFHFLMVPHPLDVREKDVEVATKNVRVISSIPKIIPILITKDNIELNFTQNLGLDFQFLVAWIDG